MSRERLCPPIMASTEHSWPRSSLPGVVSSLLYFVCHDTSRSTRITELTLVPWLPQPLCALMHALSLPHSHLLTCAVTSPCVPLLFMPALFLPVSPHVFHTDMPGYIILMWQASVTTGVSGITESWALKLLCYLLCLQGRVTEEKESRSIVTSSPNDKQIDLALWLWQSKQG